MKTSVKELAEKHGVEYADARGMVKWLEKVGHAKIVEKRPAASGKGKPTDIYELPDSVTLNLAAA